MNFKNVISSLEMERYGFYYISFFSVVYFCISYFLLTKYAGDTYCLAGVVLLNILSVSSIIIYCRNLENEREANIKGGHLIIAPLYVTLFYLGYFVLVSFRF